MRRILLTLAFEARFPDFYVNVKNITSFRRELGFIEDYTVIVINDIAYNVKETPKEIDKLINESELLNDG